jgi:integrase
MSGQPFYWQAKDGWYLWVRGATGKRKRVFMAKTKKAAWIVWKDRLARSVTDVEDPPFARLAERWVERQELRHNRKEVSKAWLKRVKRTIDAFNAANPGLRCSSITPEIATAWLGQCSVAYEHTEVSTLKRVLNWGVEQSALARSPLAGMKLSKGARRERIISLEEHRKLVSHAQGPIRALLWFAWLTGCRPSELRHLQWGQITKDCSQAILVEHKNARSTGKHRVVFFPPTARAILARHRKATGFVFLNSRGQPWTKDTLVGWMRKLRQRSGLEGTAYAYRHSYATRALEQGVAVADLAEILGTSVEVISRNYSHLDKSKQRLADIAAGVK